MSVFSAQSSIKSFVDRKISIDERNTVNKQLLYAFISANVPFSFVENPEVIKLFNTIRPSYKLPSRKTLSTEILENVHTNIESQIENFVAESKFLTLSGDGWTDVSQHSIISFALTNEKRISHLWKTEDFSSQRLTGIIIFNKYKEIGLDKWIAFASDSGPEFVNSNLAISKLRELAENYNLRFQYPCITRWGSFIKVAEQILKYKNQLKILESEHAKLGHVIASWAWLRGVIEKIPSNLDSIKINLGQEIEKRWKKIYESYFKSNSLWQPSITKDPTRFWKSVLTLCPNLSAFASRLFAIPPNSATSERIWSLFGNIHTERRNRLKPECVAKLAKIGWYINQTNKNKQKQDSKKNFDDPIVMDDCNNDIQESIDEDQIVNELYNEFQNDSTFLIDNVYTVDNGEDEVPKLTEIFNFELVEKSLKDGIQTIPGPMY
ncbi:14177_t:CDS:2 [Entrophospora sp. SA101]|nr:14177_t:CDS:2 [Entrophospora sp. SA101]